MLTALWAGIRASRRGRENSSGELGTSVVSALAVGCPICNKVVVGLLGVSGALSMWAPIQPVLAVLSVAALLAAVIVRWRRRDCTDESCAPETPEMSVISARLSSMKLNTIAWATKRRQVRRAE
jgi:hypothetical protein